MAPSVALASSTAGAFGGRAPRPPRLTNTHPTTTRYATYSALSSGRRRVDRGRGAQANAELLFARLSTPAR